MKTNVLCLNNIPSSASRKSSLTWEFLLTVCRDDAHFYHFMRRRHYSNIYIYIFLKQDFSGCAGTLDQSGLELPETHLSRPPWVLGLKVQAIVAGFKYNFDTRHLFKLSLVECLHSEWCTFWTLCSSYWEMHPTSTELVTMTPRKVMAGWNGVCLDTRNFLEEISDLTLHPIPACLTFYIHNGERDGCCHPYSRRGFAWTPRELPKCTLEVGTQLYGI